MVSSAAMIYSIALLTIILIAEGQVEATNKFTSTRGQQKSCYASEQEDAPWLAKIYRKDQEEPFCVGAVIGSNEILTTATCMFQAHDTYVWVKIQGSVNSEANYTVISKLYHPTYVSGTRLYDLAILSTLSSIIWPSGEKKGACLDPQLTLPVNSECKAAFIDAYDAFEMVPISITRGSCFRSDNVADAMCGTGSLAEVYNGTPIVCPKDNRYVMVGLTKKSYPSDEEKILLVNLDYIWITKTLKRLTPNLQDSDFTYRLNY